MGKLTPTMLKGLRMMEVNLRHRSSTMAEPNENTGRALRNRGLVEFVERRGGWNYYQITEAGRAALRQAEER